MKWKWALVPFPAALGTFLAVFFSRSPSAPNPVLYVRADLGTLLLLVGLIASGAIAVGLGLWDGSGRRGRRQAAARVRAEALEDRRRFLRRLDHELKNPLTAIRVALANLADMPHPDQRREALASVEAQALRLSRLTADLRKLAELETRPLERAAVDMADLLRQAVSLAQERPEADERRLTLTLPQAPWPLPAVAGDHDLLFLAAHNLLDNAVKFSCPGDTLEMRAFEDGTNVVVEVADTGPGIPEAEVPHVWEELYRGQGARGVPGSGLGLALVRAIVTLHGGQITLRSRAGQGTVVTMRLPTGVPADERA